MTDTSKIVRFSDWEERLKVYLDRVADERFKWGAHDCALFAASAVRAMTGFDPAEAFRGAYSTKRDAAAALRQHGAGTLLRTVKAVFGDPIPLSLAKRGDLVMLNATTVGVCVGGNAWFVGLDRDSGRHGIQLISTTLCRYAFSVPFEAAQ